MPRMFSSFSSMPAAHHDVSLLLHALNVVLLFWVLQRATGYVGRSAMVAALFALHPINVESVVWIAERKNLLSMLFFLLALGAYRWYALRPRIGRYSVVALLYAMGLMCKPQVITLPFVLLAMGLLAAPSHVSQQPGSAPHRTSFSAALPPVLGEDAVTGSVRCQRHRYHQGTVIGRRNGLVSAVRARRQRPGFLRTVHRKSFLAGAPYAHVPSPWQFAAGMASGAVQHSCCWRLLRWSGRSAATAIFLWDGCGFSGRWCP